MKKKRSFNLIELDQWLLMKVFTPPTLWFQRLTGFDNFWLGKNCLIAWLIGFGGWEIWLLFNYQNKPSTSTLNVICILLFFLFGKIMAKVGKKLTPSNFRNPLENSALLFIFRCCTVTGGSLGGISGYIFRLPHEIPASTTGLICFGMILYVLSCTPGPPQKGKLRELFERMLKQSNPSSVGAPA